MKIELDLSKSYNNRMWTNKKELEEYINSMLQALGLLSMELQEECDASTIEYVALGFILDMFNSFEVKESDL